MVSAERRVRSTVNWKETKCGKCKIQRKRPVCNSCFSYDKFIPIAITNADRIRSMSDGELADFIEMKQFFALANNGTDGEEYTLKWLQSEVEE